ncbi:MAG TPA: hypothetical protein VJV79_11055 [Polyangiaceae bacterium]|nr:hypothetical protein [Polyangiaceae bacterium]
MAKALQSLARSVCLVCAVSLGACVMPPSASEKASEAARELNLSARFGNMDAAAAKAASEVRADFVQRHAAWGKELRVVDVELGGMSMPDSDHAVFQVDYSWMRTNESTMRSTRVTQRWTSLRGAWSLESETRTAGDVGLFGEHVEILRPVQRNAQFATKVIRAD